MSNGNDSISRRNFLGNALKGAAVLTVAASGTASAAPKLPKAGVQYQPKPKNGNRCDGCKFWVDGGKCTKVKGDIDAAGWCTMWQPA